MRICYFVHTMGLGGAERRIVLLANAAVRAGHEAQIVTVLGPGEFPEPCLPEVRAEPPLARRLGPAALLRLARLLRRTRPDVFHGFLNSGNYLGCPVARLAGVPVVVGGLGTVLSYHPPALRLVARAAFALTDHATANSGGVRSFYQHQFGFAATKLTTIPNLIQVAAWPCRDAEMRASVRHELELDDHELAVVVVGRFMWKKGHAHLIDAAARLQPSLPVRFVLAGDGPLRADLEAQARRLGVAHRIAFIGVRRDIPRLLQGMDLCCLPSEIEGMPNVVLEAMAAGLPTVATRVAGADELVLPGVTGWLVPPASPLALADALAEALRVPGRLAAFGRAARRRVEHEFDESVVAPRYFALYESLLASRRVTA